MRVRELRPGSSANSATKLPPDSDSRAAPLPFFRPHNRTWITRPDFRLFPLFCALFFPLLPIVPAPAAFLSPFQGLALYLVRIFHCRSIVFCLGQLLDFPVSALRVDPDRGDHRVAAVERQLGGAGRDVDHQCGKPEPVGASGSKQGEQAYPGLSETKSAPTSAPIPDLLALNPDDALCRGPDGTVVERDGGG